MKYKTKINTFADKLKALESSVEAEEVTELYQEAEELSAELEEYENQLDEEIERLNNEETAIDSELNKHKRLNCEHIQNIFDGMDPGMKAYLKQNSKMLFDLISPDEQELTRDGCTPESIIKSMEQVSAIHKKVKSSIEETLPFPDIPLQNEEYLDILEQTLGLQEKVKELLSQEQEDKHESGS